jgi:pimeloyl-ACP methyl ester carboxylesterase
VKERVVRFGAEASLVGIVTEPAADAPRGGPAVLFLNSGLLHRVGGSRMHVRMARALAAMGRLCLRFDYSGLGDSETRKDSVPFEQSGVLETRDAMNYLAKAKGAERFVLVGLCSGADMAFYTAIEDPRVVGIFQIDPFDYRTPRSYLYWYGPKIFSRQPWLNVLRGRTHLGAWLKSRLSPAPASSGEEQPTELVQSPYARAFPPREVVAQGLLTLVQRGVRIYAYFTGDRDHCYQGQFKAAFHDIDFGACLTEEYRAKASHLVTDLGLQRDMDQHLSAWLSGIPAPQLP